MRIRLTSSIGTSSHTYLNSPALPTGGRSATFPLACPCGFHGSLPPETAFKTCGRRTAHAPPCGLRQPAPSRSLCGRRIALSLTARRCYDGAKPKTDDPPCSLLRPISVVCLAVLCSLTNFRSGARRPTSIKVRNFGTMGKERRLLSAGSETEFVPLHGHGALTHSSSGGEPHSHRDHGACGSCRRTERNARRWHDDDRKAPPTTMWGRAPWPV